MNPVICVNPSELDLRKLYVGCLWGCRYLHEVCSPPVVHRNFKTANILLDNDLNAHVSDCGLAALTPSSAESQVHFSHFSFPCATVDAAFWNLPLFAMNGLTWRALPEMNFQQGY